jgi:hypothetical protein
MWWNRLFFFWFFMPVGLSDSIETKDQHPIRLTIMLFSEKNAKTLIFRPILIILTTQL